MERKIPCIAETILRIKKQSWNYNPSRLQTTLQSYNKHHGTDTKMDTSVEQNRETKINLWTYGQLIYDRGGKNVYSTISLQ